jgi:lipid II:glycine glycyltransferase (peptidoglycan interpeptide bridge formation enzyme)
VASLTTKEVTDKKTWEDFIASHTEANFWGDFHLRLNHAVVRQGIYEGNNLVGASQSIVESAKRGKHLVLPGGPIIDWQNKAVVNEWLSSIKQAAKTNKCLFVRVRPQILDTPEHRQLFKKLGFIKAPMHVTADLTSQLDLSKTEEEVKRGMRKGARYDLNQSQKLGIKVELAVDDRFMEEFYKLHHDTAIRQKFIPFTRKFLTEQFNTFAAEDKVVMYRSTFEGKLLAMAFVIFYGPEAAYHYGASTELARKYPGAYAVQWEAISEARRRGCKRYNFWGVTEHGKTKHRFYGVSVFKRGFGGEDVAYLPAHDLVINKARYSATYAFETARRKFRRL